MSIDDTTTASGSAEWAFPTLAYVWDAKTKAIMVGADRLDALSDADRARSLTVLSQRVRALTRGLDDGWLVATAFFMVDDVYKSYTFTSSGGQMVSATILPPPRASSWRNWLSVDSCFTTSSTTHDPRPTWPSCSLMCH